MAGQIIDIHPTPLMNKSLIEFPCLFPIKVMGKNEPDFAQSISDLLLQKNSGFKPEDIEMRPSSGKRYIGLTVKVWVNNQTELDEIYQSLTQHPMVQVVL